MAESILQSDLILLNFIRDTFHCAFLDFWMPLITHLGDKGILWIAIGFILAIFKKTRFIGIGVLLSLLMSLIFGNLLIKPLIGRARPFEADESIKLLIARPTDFSFPSGHSFASFAAASAVFFRSKKYGTFAFVLASLIAFSRLYLYVHFPSDVLFGILFGIAAGYCSYRLVKHFFKA